MATASVQGAHVVLIEDDPSITVGLRMNLEAEGYRVSIADDGETGGGGGRAAGRERWE